MSQIKKLNKLHRREMRELRAKQKNDKLTDRGGHSLGSGRNSPFTRGKLQEPQIDN